MHMMPNARWTSECLTGNFKHSLDALDLPKMNISFSCVCAGAKSAFCSRWVSCHSCMILLPLHYFSVLKHLAR